MSRIAAKHWERVKNERDADPAMHDAMRTGGRGRHADGPTSIPAKGWKDVAWRLYQEVSDDRVLLVAAGVTFYLLLALGPLLAALVSIYGLVLDPANISEQVGALAGVVPGGGVDILSSQLERLASTNNSTLGFAFLLSLGIALWSANAGMKSLFDAMNIAYDEREERGFVRYTLVTLAFTVSLIVAIIVLAGFNAAFTTFQSAIGLKIPNNIVNVITALLALTVLIVFLAMLYRYGPSREDAEWKWITPGAIFAGIGGVVVSALFTFYVANFGTYNETYGSLGAIIGFLTWLWLMMVVIVMGGELNSELEHQTARDTTTGPARPMGERGAVMADNVGRKWGKDAPPSSEVSVGPRDRRSDTGDK